MMEECRKSQERGPGMGAAERARRNRGVALSFALVCALVLLLVSGLPGPLIAPALDQLFGLAALGASIAAVLWREPVLAPHLSHWDKAAALAALSILSGLYTEPALVEQTLAELAETGGAGISAVASQARQN